jgi:ABC-type amino acid transport substrate-binding protein
MTRAINQRQHGRINQQYLLTASRCHSVVLMMIGALILALSMPGTQAFGGDLEDVLKAGKLRHLGIPYANFVSNQGEGLDVEVMKLFAAYLGVKYEFVESSWNNIIPDLTGKTINPKGSEVEVTGSSPVRGDVIGTGFTVLAWREKIVDFSTPAFPTGVWLIARADSALSPITPTGDIIKDIEAVKSGLQGTSVLAMKDSCLDPALYHMQETGAEVKLFPPERDLDEMIPSVIAGSVDTTLMDVPVALIALERWAGEIKVVGPVSLQQEMAYAFDKSALKLRAEFEKFFSACKADNTYQGLVNKYYPTVFSYYPDFFKK